MTRCLWAVTLLVLLAPMVSGAEPADMAWPILLGPRRDGISRDTGLNLDWTQKKPKVGWKVPLGGGCSSLAIAEDRIYTMANRGDKDLAVCFDAKDGKELWMREMAPRFLDNQGHGPGPRSTPTVDRGRLYCLMPLGDLVCLNAADGKEVWRTNILEATATKSREKEFRWWGLSLSPLVDGDLVIVQPGGNKDTSVAAFHRCTGKLVWSCGNDPLCYASTIIIAPATR